MLYYPTELATLISQLAVELQQECIRRTRMNQVKASMIDKRDWRGPALRPNLSLGETDLNELPRLLYGHPVSLEYIERTWAEAAALLEQRHTRKEVKTLLSSSLPGVPFGPPPGSGAEEWVAQWLQFCSWSHGTLVVDHWRCTLELPSGEIGLDHKGLLRPGRYRRYRHINEVRAWDALKYPLGRPKPGLRDACAVCRHLMEVFPEASRQIDLLFATAVAAGHEYQRLITDQFDVIPLYGDLERESVWTQCRRLIEGSSSNPLASLYDLLLPVLGHDAFVVYFGNPHRRVSSIYTERSRAKHGRLLDKIESGEISAAKLRLTGSEAGQDVAALLDLQQLIGRT